MCTKPAKRIRTGSRKLVKSAARYVKGMVRTRAGCWRRRTAPKRKLYPPMETTMSTPRLPPELLDHIVDFVCDSQVVLRNCCLISKSWIPSTRKHLFANIRFDTAERLRSWKETFPDPSTSPAHYTKTLIIDCIQVVTTEDAEEGGWIRSFSSVVCLGLGRGSRYTDGSTTSLLPFHGLSPAIKSLRVNFHSLPSSLVFDLILSFPLLEDLKVLTRDESIDDCNGSRPPSTVVQPSGQPMTGSLELSQWGGMGFITSRLLSLPGGIHFRKLVLTWSRGEDISSTMSLVEGCSHSVEYLEVACGPLGTSIRRPPPHRQLISNFSRVEARLDRPLEGDEAQRIGVSGRVAGGRLDHYGTPNYRTRASNLSTNHNLPALRPRPHRFWCQCQANRRRTGFWAVVGAGPSPCPTLGVAFDPPEDHLLFFFFSFLFIVLRRITPMVHIPLSGLGGLGVSGRGSKSL